MRDKKRPNQKRGYFLVTLIPGPRDLFVSLVITATYLMCFSYLNVSYKTRCSERRFADDVTRQNEASTIHTDPQFENEIILELLSIKKDKTWLDSDCRGNSCTRVIWQNMTGSINSSNSYNESLEMMGIPKVTPPQAKPYTAIKLMDCNEMDMLYDGNMSEAFIEIGMPENDIWTGLRIKRGTVKRPFFADTRYVNLKEADANTKGYQYLEKELEKRRRLGWNIPGLQEFYGVCKTDNKIRLADEYVQGTSVCDERVTDKEQFDGSDCYHMLKLKYLINKSGDKPNAALKFIKSIICLFGELEERSFFVDNLHGSMFKLLDMSVVLSNLDDMFYYGSTNIYGDGICLYDSQCPSPNGTNWYNGSTNSIFYNKCQDVKPKCTNNRCAGYNASMHFCGLSRWLQNLYSSLENDLEKSRFLHAMTLVSHSFPMYRNPGRMACDEITDTLDKYNKAKKLGTFRKKANSFHVGTKKKPS